MRRGIVGKYRAEFVFLMMLKFFTFLELQGLIFFFFFKSFILESVGARLGMKFIFYIGFHFHKKSYFYVGLLHPTQHRRYFRECASIKIFGCITSTIFFGNLCLL
jgi:hypothetical protein